MIVLDEQLLGRGIEEAIGRWYPGAVVFINDLRPDSVIKDDVIPALLSQARQPTFVTINETDFWRRFPASPRYCLICFALSDAQAGQIPASLQRLLRHPELSTKATRLGKVVRVTTSGVLYYTAPDRSPQSLEIDLPRS